MRITGFQVALALSCSVLSQDLNEYAMHVILLVSMTLAYLAVKKGSQSQNNLHEVGS